MFVGISSIIKQLKPKTTTPTIGTLSGSEDYTQVTLTWGAGYGAYGIKEYKIYQDSTYIHSVDSDTTSYTVTGLTNDTEYDFYVVTVDKKNNTSSPSNTVSLTPQSIDLGLSDVLISIPAQNNATWTEYTADINKYINHTVRIVVLSKTNGNYTGDNQIDDINVGGNSYDPENGTESFQRNSALANGTTEYATVSWESLATSETQGKWNRDYNGTPSSNTGNVAGHTGDYYFYTEVSNYYTTDYRYWLRGPECTVSNGTLSIWVAQNGAACGPIEIYLDVIS